MSSGVGDHYSPWHELHGEMACCACTPWLRLLCWSARNRRPKVLSMLVGVTQPTILRSVRWTGDVLTSLPSDRALLVDPFHGFAFVGLHSQVTICGHGLCPFCSLHLGRWRKPYGLDASTSAEAIQNGFPSWFSPLATPARPEAAPQAPIVALRDASDRCDEAKSN